MDSFLKFGFSLFFLFILILLFSLFIYAGNNIDLGAVTSSQTFAQTLVAVIKLAGMGLLFVAMVFVALLVCVPFCC